MTNIYLEKVQEPYCRHHQIQETNQRDFYRTQKALSFPFSPSQARRKSEAQKFFLKKSGSKKFHNGNQQQQQQSHIYYGQTESQQLRYGRYNCSTINLLEYGFEFGKSNSVGIKKVSPTYKKIISVKKFPRCSICGKIETFCRGLHENNTGSQNFGHSKSMQNFISSSSFSVKNPFPANSESRRERIGETGGKRNVEEGSHQQIQPSKGKFVFNLFLVKRKMRAKDQ